MKFSIILLSMLKQASISQIRSGELTREKGYISVCMRTYPRGLKKELIDEYRCDLAPAIDLFKDFKQFQASDGHDQAFIKSDYERRFDLGRRPLQHLEILVQQSRTQDVYLACQCEIGQRCHREILLGIAEKRFGAQIGEVFSSYPNFFNKFTI